jgi:hypothetical protein
MLYYIMLYHIMLYYIMLYHIMLYYIMLYYIMLYYIMLYYIMLYYIISCYTILCYIILYYVILYYVILYHVILHYIVVYYIPLPVAPSSLSWTVEVRRALSNDGTGFISKTLQINAYPFQRTPPYLICTQLNTVQWVLQVLSWNPVQEFCRFRVLLIDRPKMGGGDREKTLGGGTWGCWSNAMHL